jgi:hypothetical protein
VLADEVRKRLFPCLSDASVTAGKQQAASRSRRRAKYREEAKLVLIGLIS